MATKPIHYKQKYYPEWLLAIIAEDGNLTWEQHAKIITNGFKVKRRVSYHCDTCNKKQSPMSRDINRRVYNKYEPLCSRCAHLKATSDPVWKKKNSDTQLIAQNKPEQLKRNSDAVKKFWEQNPETKRVVAEKISLLHETDPEYRLKVQRSKYKGKVETRFGKLHFDSKLELYYLLKIENDSSIKTVTRWNKKGIPYEFDGVIRKYYPDFIVNEDRIIELKGDFLFKLRGEEITAKAEAAKAKYPDLRYTILTSKDVPYERSLQYLARIAKREIEFFHLNVREEYESYL